MSTQFNKAIVALVMGIFGILNVAFDLPIPITEDQLSALLMALTPFLVWLTPNKKPSE